MDLNLKALMEFNSANLTSPKDRDFFRATKYNLIDISEPLMIVFSQLETYYFAYALQNRTVLMKNGEIADIQELLIAKTTLNTVIDLLEEKIDIKHSLFSCEDEVYQVGKVSGRSFPLRKINNFEEVQTKLPLEGVKLDHRIPNKINLEKTLKILKKELQYQGNFMLSTNRIEKKMDVEVINNNWREILDNFSRKEMKPVKYEVEV